MRLYTLISTVGILVCSCTTENLSRRNVDEYVMPSNTVQYFLPLLPSWANTSPTAGCTRNYPLGLLDFAKLKKSFLYSHEQSIALQHTFNIERINLLEDRRHKVLGLAEEESLFYEVSDKIRLGIRTFIVPKFKRIHLVWIDPFVTGQKDIKILKKLFKNADFGKGHPVFVSQCLNHGEVEHFIKEYNIPNATRILSSEFLTPFDLNFKLTYQLAIYIDPIFKGKNVFLYSPIPVPHSLVGTVSDVHLFK